MSEKIEIKDGAYKKDDPHKDIGKQKFRVKKSYTCWVEYDVVADSKDEAESVVMEHSGIERIEWADGYHNGEPVEVYAHDYDMDFSSENGDFVKKVAECVPYEDWDSDTGKDFENYEDPDWTEDEYRWKKDAVGSTINNEEEEPF